MDIRIVQETIGVLLYHARALNLPLLSALNTLGIKHAAVTENTIIADSPNSSIIVLLTLIRPFVSLLVI